MADSFRARLRPQLLDIAERLLSEQGLHALQARRLAQLADCSVGTLYNVYESLDALIIAANARTLEQLGSALVDARDNAPAGHIEQTLLAMALAYMQFAVERESAWRSVFEHRLAPGGEVPQWYRERQGELFGLVEANFAGAIRDEAERRRAARALFSAVHGIIAMGLDRKLGEFDRNETEAQVRLIVRAVARGLVGGAAVATADGDEPATRLDPR